MKNKHTIKINLDPCNPGQYFACCGLLAVADRLSTGAKAWFDCPDNTPRQGSFFIATDVPIEDEILTVFDDAAVIEEPLFGDPYKNPITIDTKNVGYWYLDWWLESDYLSANSALKNWAGTIKIKEDLFEHWFRIIKTAREFESPLCDLFDISVAGKKINIDPRSSFNGGLSIGYSPNKMNYKTEIYPFVELFGAIGLQYNRPTQGKSKSLFYHIWNRPIPFAVASIAIANYGHLDTEWFLFKQEVNSELGKNTPYSFSQRQAHGR